MLKEPIKGSVWRLKCAAAYQPSPSFRPQTVRSAAPSAAAPMSAPAARPYQPSAPFSPQVNTTGMFASQTAQRQQMRHNLMTSPMLGAQIHQTLGSGVNPYAGNYAGQVVNQEQTNRLLMTDSDYQNQYQQLQKLGAAGRLKLAVHLSS